MARDDVVVLAVQDRVGEAERGDRGGNLGDLIGRMVRALRMQGTSRAVCIISICKGTISGKGTAR